MTVPMPSTTPLPAPTIANRPRLSAPLTSSIASDVIMLKGLPPGGPTPVFQLNVAAGGFYFISVCPVGRDLTQEPGLPTYMQAFANEGAIVGQADKITTVAGDLNLDVTLDGTVTIRSDFPGPVDAVVRYLQIF